MVLRDANGRDVRLAKTDVASLTPSKVSLMPDNVVSQISYEQFIDLLAFLKSQKEQEDDLPGADIRHGSRVARFAGGKGEERSAWPGRNRSRTRSS